MTQIALRSQGLRAIIETLGATLLRLQVRVPNGWRDVVLGSLDDPYMGRTIGRFANRLDGGRFTIDGVASQISINEPPNALHGGVEGFSQQPWQVVASSASGTALRLTSRNGDQGFPGRLEVVAVFDVADRALTVAYAATTNAATPINLTLHTYFNLDPTASTIDRHQLQIPAAMYTPTRPDGIPTGVVAPVAGTGLDFTQERILDEARRAMIAGGLDRGGSLDHNFVVPGDGVRPMATLTAPDGLTLTVLSDAPACQIYDAAGFDGTVTGWDDRRYGPHAGLAIEPQDYPDAPNHPDFPNVILRTGRTWSRTITYAAS